MSAKKLEKTRVVGTLLATAAIIFVLTARAHGPSPSDEMTSIEEPAGRPALDRMIERFAAEARGSHRPR